jgi:hypothetical protein
LRTADRDDGSGRFTRRKNGEQYYRCESYAGGWFVQHVGEHNHYDHCDVDTGYIYIFVDDYDDRDICVADALT